MPPSTKREILWSLLGVLVFFLLNYPLLGIFNRDTFVAGVPLLIFYVFGVYILAIVGLYAMSRRLTPPEPPDREETRQ